MPVLEIGLHEGVSHKAYHDDPCEVPSLSASIAMILLRDSPDHARCAHPRLTAFPNKADDRGEEEEGGEGVDEGEPEKENPFKSRGTLIHALALGGGVDLETVMKCDAKTGLLSEADTYQTKSARAHKAAIIASGRVPVIASKLKAARMVADEIARKVPLPKVREVTGVWESDGVLCRGRIDALDMPQRYDLKTCESAARAATGNHVLDFGLHIAEASYTDMLETLYPELRGKVPPMQYIFFEVKKPHGFLIRTIDAELREEGERCWRQAKRTWQRCLESDNWPNYEPGIGVIDAPPKLAALQLERMVKNPNVVSQDVSF